MPPNALNCLITGATSGIGHALVRLMLDRRATVLAVARSEAKARRLAADLNQLPGQLEVLVADLSEQRQVRRLADEVAARAARLDILVNNAALITRTRQETSDGIEMQLAVNHLAPFLLTNLLRPLITRSTPARIVTVASQVEAAGRLDLGDLQRGRGYRPLDAYCQSKLANVLFTYELARRLHGSGVDVNCVHPGVVGTALLDSYVGRPWPLTVVNRLRNDSPRVAAERILPLLVDPDLNGTSGCYFCDGHPCRSSPQSYDSAQAERLWEASERLTGL